MSKAIQFQFKSGILNKHQALEVQITHAENSVDNTINSDERDWDETSGDISDADMGIDVDPVEPDFSDDDSIFNSDIETIRTILDSPTTKFVNVWGRITSVKLGTQIVQQHMKKAEAMLQSIPKATRKMNKDIKMMHKKHHKTSAQVKRDRGHITNILFNLNEAKANLEHNIKPNQLTKKMAKVIKLSDKIFNSNSNRGSLSKELHFTSKTIKPILDTVSKS